MRPLYPCSDARVDATRRMIVKQSPGAFLHAFGVRVYFPVTSDDPWVQFVGGHDEVRVFGTEHKRRAFVGRCKRAHLAFTVI